MAEPPSGKRLIIKGGPAEIGGSNPEGLPALDVEAELREVKDKVQNITNALEQGGIDATTPTDPPEDTSSIVLPENLLTVPKGDARYSPLNHTHPTLPTSAQKTGLQNITGSNYAVGIVDLNTLIQNTIQAGFIFRFNIPGGAADALDITDLLDGELVQESSTSPGLVPDEIVFIRKSDTLREIESNSFNVYGILRQTIPVTYSVPSQNRTTLNAGYTAGQTTMSLTSNVFKAGDTIILTSDPATAALITTTQGNTLQFNPGEAPTEDLLSGSYVYKAIPGEGIVAEKTVSLWIAGVFEGDILGVTSPNQLQPGLGVVINPGEATEEVRIISDVLLGATPRDLTRITFSEALDHDHEAGEPVVLLSLSPLVEQARVLSIEFKVDVLGGGAAPYTMAGELLDLMLPYRFLFQDFPQNTLISMAKFLHGAGGSGGSPSGSPPVTLIDAIGSGAFAGDSLPSVVTHSLDLSSYAVMLTVRYATSTAGIGPYGTDLSQNFLDSFTVRNVGGSATKEYDWAILAIPPTALYSPMKAAGIATFTLGGTAVVHNKGLTPASTFVLVEPLWDGDLASIGAFAVDSIEAHSFVVKVTGDPSTTQFRWAVFDTSALPTGKMEGFGTGTFSGAGVATTINHGLGIVGDYFVKIVPKYGPELAGVGEYSVDPGTKTGNSFDVRNTGADTTTEFYWAIFVE